MALSVGRMIHPGSQAQVNWQLPGWDGDAQVMKGRGGVVLRNSATRKRKGGFFYHYVVFRYKMHLHWQFSSGPNKDVCMQEMGFKTIIMIYDRFKITMAGHWQNLWSHISNCLGNISTSVSSRYLRSNVSKSKLIIIPPQASSLLNSVTQSMTPYPTLFKC